MADFFPLISRAVAGLREQTPEARNAIYERARAALEGQLRALDPPLPDADIARQRLALDEAIARVETQAAEDAAYAAERAADQEPPAPVFESAPAPRPAPAPSAPPRPAAAPAESVQTGTPRPRIAAPVPARDRSNRTRMFVVGGVLGAIIVAIATAAILTRDHRPARIDPDPERQAAAPAGGDTKINDRIDGPAPTQQPGQNGTPPAQRSEQRVPEVPGGPRNEVGVAQRAMFIEEASASGQQPSIFTGRAIWRLDSVNDGQGSQVETAIRADVEFAEAGLTMVFVVRRNTDPTLPASHLVQLTFGRNEIGKERSVRDVGVPVFKQEETGAGTPLSGLVVPVTENIFLIGLANLSTEVTRNMDLLRTRAWVEIPMRFTNGRRAVINFEKGVSGDRTINEALNAWR